MICAWWCCPGVHWCLGPHWAEVLAWVGPHPLMNRSWQPRGHFNIKTVFPGIGIPIIKIRRSYLYNENSYTGNMAFLYCNSPSSQLIASQQSLCGCCGQRCQASGGELKNVNHAANSSDKNWWATVLLSSPHRGRVSPCSNILGTCLEYLSFPKPTRACDETGSWSLLLMCLLSACCGFPQILCYVTSSCVTLSPHPSWQIT